MAALLGLSLAQLVNSFIDSRIKIGLLKLSLLYMFRTIMKFHLLVALGLFSPLCTAGEGDGLFSPENEEAGSGWPKSIAPTEEQLKGFKAENLKNNKQKESIFVRFLWQPTFDSPLLITAFKSEEGKTLSIKRMSGKGGYDWGKINLNKSIKLTDAQWNRIVKLYQVKGARKPSESFKGSMKDNFVEAFSGLDGSRWFLEVKDSKGYTVEGIPNPLQDNQKPAKFEELGVDLEPFVAVCKELLKLSKLEVKELY